LVSNALVLVAPVRCAYYTCHFGNQQLFFFIA